MNEVGTCFCLNDPRDKNFASYGMLQYSFERIVSLVPSLTELLFDLKLGKRIVGITWFCIHHPQFNKFNPLKIGGTKNPDLSKILFLKPDCVIASKEENRMEDIYEILKNGINVILTDIVDYDSEYQAIEKIGTIFQKERKATEIISALQGTRINFSKKGSLGTAIYLIWNNPIMAVGGDSYIHHQIDFVGFKNLLGNQKRYPTLEISEIMELNPDYLLLSSEPFPFTDKHMAEFEKILPNSKIKIVDGEFFSWYGTRHLHLGKEYSFEL